MIAFTRHPADEALNALEDMVFQYLAAGGDRSSRDYCHMFMSAGEHACAVLAKQRASRWQLTEIGVRFIGEMDYDGMYGEGRP